MKKLLFCAAMMLLSCLQALPVNAAAAAQPFVRWSVYSAAAGNENALRAAVAALNTALQNSEGVLAVYGGEDENGVMRYLEIYTDENGVVQDYSRGYSAGTGNPEGYTRRYNNRPQNNQGGYKPRNNFQKRDNGGYNQRRPQRPGARPNQRRPQKPNKQRPLLVNKEQLAQIEEMYKKMLPLPNPDAHEVIAQAIDLEPKKVFFGINLIRQKMMLPKVQFPKRKLAITPDQMMAIKNLYEPLLPLPPIGCHKIIAAQLKMDEWRVHVGIGLVRKQMGLDRWNQDREDAPEEFKKKAQE